MTGRGRRAVPVIAAAVTAIVVAGVLFMRSEVRPVSVTTTPSPTVPRLVGDYTPAFDFVDPRHGWAIVVGYGAPRFWVFVTTDGAAHWKQQFSATAVGGWTYLRFFDLRHGFVYAGTLYRTVDGGADWQALRMPADGPFFGFATPTFGWQLGPGLYSTDDGGVTWTAVDTPLPADAMTGAAGTSSELAFRSNGEGWLAAAMPDPTVYHTGDGGLTWNAVSLPNPQPGFDSYTTTVSLLPVQGVLAIVGSPAGVIGAYYSDDLGVSWRLVEPLLPQTEWIADASFLDATHWWVGRYGFLYKTSTAGQDWVRVLVQPLPTGWNIGPVHVIDVDHGWWTMVSTSDSRDNALMMTADGGANWRAVSMPQPA